jgi:hypothetical protein
MKYVCLVYYQESEIGKMSQSDWDALNAECVAYGESITNSGHRLGGQALEPTHTATTVRVRNGKVSTTDGPFAETKEQLAGFYYVDAKDLNEAIQIAAKIPPARLGTIEVRPVRELIQERGQADVDLRPPRTTTG